MPKDVVPYGLWPSPITPGTVSQGLRLDDLAWDSDGQTLVWLEVRSGHGVLVCMPPDANAPRDLTTELSVRARVGYGGGDMTAAHGNAYFVSGGRIYHQPLSSGEAKPITPAFGDAAAPTMSPDGKWVLYVHTYEDIDGLAVVDSEGSLWPQKLAYGDDFYMQPAWHPSGRQIAWVSWNHPNMPWDGTKLVLATLDVDGPGTATLADSTVVAASSETAVFEPEFSPDGRYLSYISDANGWDNLYLFDLKAQQHRPLVVCDADLGIPAWRQGMRTYGWRGDSATIYYCRSEQGSTSLWSVDAATGDSAPMPGLDQYTSFSQIDATAPGQLAFIGSGAQVPARVVVYSPASGTAWVRARAESESVPREFLSEPEHITWPSAEGDEVHGLFYAPRSHRFRSPGRPPLIVQVHGGPTGQSRSSYSPGVQFFTTRGYAVLQVNYRGSTGYGRVYRNKLRGHWGLYDTDDSVCGARHLANQGLVDGDRMVIAGGSAGGYTVLQALIRYPGTFKAGLCSFGVTNLFTLASDTHKFERHYLDSMIGPLPQMAHRYRERSPVFAADRIVDPVAVFQGEEDRVVPRDQAEAIVEALRRNGVPHEYHLYPGEGHGWRKAETIRAFYESVLGFLKKHVLFA